MIKSQKIPRLSPALSELSERELSRDRVSDHEHPKGRSELLESKATMKRPPQTEEVFKRFEIGLYEAALRSNPNNVEALRSLGYIYSSEGLHDKAVEIDKRLVRLLPEESIVHYNLACSYSQLNNLEGALSELEMSMLLGYNDWKHMDGDKDLDNLKKDPATSKYWPP